MTSASFTLGSRFNTAVIAQRDMDDTALVRRHRAKLDAAMLIGSLVGGRTRDRLELLTLAVLISLHIDDHRITVPDGTDGDGRDHELQGVERFSMTSNQNGKIIAGDVKDELAVVALVLIDGDVAHIEMLQDILQRGDRGVGDAVQLLIGDLAFGGSLLRFEILRFDDLVFKFLSHCRSFHAASMKKPQGTGEGSLPLFNTGKTPALQTNGSMRDQMRVPK